MFEKRNRSQIIAFFTLTIQVKISLVDEYLLLCFHMQMNDVFFQQFRSGNKFWWCFPLQAHSQTMHTVKNSHHIQRSCIMLMSEKAINPTVHSFIHFFPFYMFGVCTFSKVSSRNRTIKMSAKSCEVFQLEQPDFLYIIHANALFLCPKLCTYEKKTKVFMQTKCNTRPHRSSQTMLVLLEILFVCFRECM